ncbi:hypothetical protein P3T23_007856 [Paraburkholderia sp. GAS448]
MSDRGRPPRACPIEMPLTPSALLAGGLALRTAVRAATGFAAPLIKQAAINEQLFYVILS